MTAPDESCTTPEIVPVVTWAETTRAPKNTPINSAGKDRDTILRMRPKLASENREGENSNTSGAEPGTLIAFPARAIFNTEFITPPFFQIPEDTCKPWKGPPRKATMTCSILITLPGEEVKRNRRECR